MMAETMAETRRTVKDWYPDLLKQLPINKLVDRFESLHLIGPDRKSKLDSLTSPEEKVKYFVDDMLSPGLALEFTGHFDEMVKMMEESDDISMKHLVEKMTRELSIAFSKDRSAEKDTSDEGTYQGCDGFLLCNTQYKGCHAHIYCRSICYHGQSLDHRNIKLDP